MWLLFLVVTFGLYWVFGKFGWHKTKKPLFEYRRVSENKETHIVFDDNLTPMFLGFALVFFPYSSAYQFFISFM